MTMETNGSKLIGCLIEYEAAGAIHRGRVLDAFRVLSNRGGVDVSHDLLMVDVGGGKVFKISPIQVKRVLSNNN